VKNNGGSVDSFVSSAALTTIPSDIIIDSSTSVRSEGGAFAWDPLTTAMEKFTMGGIAGREARVKRYVLDMIVRWNEAESEEIVENGWGKSAGARQQSSRGVVNKHRTGLGLSGVAPNLLKVVPPASLLRPPRGNLICATKDLTRELLALRRLPRAERTLTAARLIRTLDPSCPSHSDIALTIYLISTL